MDRDDDSHAAVLALAAGVVGGVLAIVLAVAIGTTRGATPPRESERLAFVPGAAGWDAPGSERLAEIAQRLREDDASVVFVTPWHAAPAGAALAARRAAAVAHALQANGAPAQRIVIDGPRRLRRGDDHVAIMVR